jgi:hypothetical protein
MYYYAYIMSRSDSPFPMARLRSDEKKTPARESGAFDLDSNGNDYTEPLASAVSTAAVTAAGMPTTGMSTTRVSATVRRAGASMS